MSRRFNYRVFAGATLTVSFLLAAMPAGAATHRMADGVSSASPQPAQVTIAEDQSGSWFSPWFIHHWPN